MPDLGDALGRLQKLDAELSLRANRAVGRGPAVAVFRAASRLGDGLFWYALMLALMLAGGADAAFPVLHMVLAGLACTATYKLLKRGTARLRPCDAGSGVCALSAPLDRFSFPSGHTLHAVCFTMIACAYYPALAGLLVPFTVLVAASRLVLGLHYPSDVFAGALVGGSIAFASLGLA